MKQLFDSTDQMDANGAGGNWLKSKVGRDMGARQSGNRGYPRYPQASVIILVDRVLLKRKLRNEED